MKSIVYQAYLTLHSEHGCPHFWVHSECSHFIKQGFLHGGQTAEQLTSHLV